MMMTTVFMKLGCLGLLCTVATSALAGDEAVPVAPVQMSEEQLVESLGDVKQWGMVYDEIVNRLKQSGYDPKSSLAKRLLATWKATEPKRIERLRGGCFFLLSDLKSQEVADILCRELSSATTRHERGMAAHALGSFGMENEAVITALRNAIAQDKGVFGEGRSIARDAIASLRELGRSGSEALMAIWKSENDRRGCEEALLTAMAWTKNKVFTPIMIGVLEGKEKLPLGGEEWLRGHAAWALGVMGDDTALPVLRKYEKDANDGIRKKVAEAINKIQQGNDPGSTKPDSGSTVQP